MRAAALGWPRSAIRVVDADLAGTCDTLVADADGACHPRLFNDRLLLGMKGNMSEAELQRGLPVGLVWGAAAGEICLHPDEAVTGVILAVHHCP